MTAALTRLSIALAERGLVPRGLVRHGIRNLVRRRLEDEHDGPGGADARVAAFAAGMREGPVAPVPEKANEQHYEVPAAFFELVLGPHLKYSSCTWPDGVATLEEAERRALDETMAHAELEDGMDILELGCGWGSLTLAMAARYPAARITAVSNSAPQRELIEARAAERGLANLTVITADMNDFEAPDRYDRVVSVEMFEHMRNYQRLLERIDRWLKPGGKLFVHVFCHRELAYPFETEGAANWMGRYFFTGGIMPSADLLSHFDQHLRVTRTWTWSGTDYAKTAEAWLVNMETRRDELMPVLASAYGETDAKRWYHRWWMFFAACAELFGYANGGEWQVCHYLLDRVADRQKAGGATSAA